MKERGKRIFVWGMAVLFLGLIVLIFTIESPAFSVRERRALRQYPNFTVSRMLDGSYAKGVGEGLRDRFPFRETFLRIYESSARAMGLREVGGVLVTEDGRLCSYAENLDLVTVEKRLESLSEFTKTCHDNGKIVTTAIVPQSIEIYYENLEIDPPMLGYDHVRKKINKKLPDVKDLSAEFSHLDRDAWFLGDHHWTALGAYSAYVSLGESLGYDPYPLTYFSAERVSTDFLGTTASRVYTKDPILDSIVLYRYEGDTEFVRKNMETGEELSGFYDWERLSTYDQYAVFLGGNTAHLSVRLPQNEGRKTLCLIKDSFANSLVPYLALHFDLEIYDPRYFRASLAEEIEKIDPDAVLCLFGIESLWQ